jgi:hypothetical protein
VTLHIDVETVTAVLLNDSWHNVADASFAVDPYDFVRSTEPGAEGGEAHGHQIGFSFRDVATNEHICGPLTSVLAIRRE